MKENERFIDLRTERKEKKKKGNGEREKERKTEGRQNKKGKIKRNMWTLRSLTNTYHQKVSVDSFVSSLSKTNKKKKKGLICD